MPKCRCVCTSPTAIIYPSLTQPWPWTLPLCPQNLKGYPCPKTHQCWNFGKIQFSNVWDIVLTRSKSAFFTMLNRLVTLNFYLLIPNLVLVPKGTTANTLQDIVLTMFGMHGQTNRVTNIQWMNNASGCTTSIGGDIKLLKYRKMQLKIMHHKFWRTRHVHLKSCYQLWEEHLGE